MNIWIIHQHAALPSQPGITRHMALARGLVAQGHKIVIFSSGMDRCDPDLTGGIGHEWTLVIDGVTFRLVPTGGYVGNGVKRVLDMLVFAWRCERPRTLEGLERPDLVIGSSPHPCSAWAGFRLAKRYRCPFVYEVRDLWPETLTAFGMSPNHPLVRVFGVMERRLAQGASAIISSLQGAKDYFQQFGVQPEDVLWLPNGIDPSLVPATPQDTEAATFEIVYAGAHGEANGLDVVLDAAHELRNRQETRHVRFRLIGAGPQKERLRQAALAKGLDNMIFDGPYPKNEIYHHLGKASAFLVMLREAPIWQWGISMNKICDYMAVGRPILFGGMTPYDPIAESGAGISFQPGTGTRLAETVVALLRLSPEQRGAMGTLGQETVRRHYDLNEHAKNLGLFLTRVHRGDGLERSSY